MGVTKKERTMKKIVALFIMAIFIASNCYAVDINEWKRGDASIPVKGTDNISDADTLISNYIVDPLDRLLTNYRAGCQLAYTSATTVTVQIGEIVCSNSGGTARRMRKNTSTTTVVMTTAGVGGLDTGSEAASTTYHVYAVADADATTFTAVCSTSATTPTGITYFRYLGSFYNNSSRNIDSTKVVSIGSGRVVQVANYQTGALATGTTTIPWDDTIPQNTEGNEFMTLSIIPKSATNKLKIEVCVFFASSGQPVLEAALFQDSTADALASGWHCAFLTTGEQPDGISFTHYMAAGTTSATTFKVRAGGSTSGTYTFNGDTAARKHGGVTASSITITEIE